MITCVKVGKCDSYSEFKCQWTHDSENTNENDNILSGICNKLESGAHCAADSGCKPFVL